MVVAHVAAGIGRLVERCQHMRGAARVAAKVVPFVGPPPDHRQILHRRVIGVLDMDGRRLDLRVVCEIGAEQPAVPSPLIFGVAGRVDAGEPAARVDKALKRSLLVRVENVVSRRAKEDDDPVSGEFRRGEAAGILGGVDAETVLGA